MARIMIIDDDIDLAMSVKLVLESGGHQIILASDPEEGWEKLLKDRPELLILDVMMPAATEGFHFVWKLRRHSDDQLSKMPIVVLSALHQTIDIKMYPNASDDEYSSGEYLPIQKFLDKPVHPETLLKTVDELLKETVETKKTA